MKQQQNLTSFKTHQINKVVNAYSRLPQLRVSSALDSFKTSNNTLANIMHQIVLCNSIYCFVLNDISDSKTMWREDIHTLGSFSVEFTFHCTTDYYWLKISRYYKFRIQSIIEWEIFRSFIYLFIKWSKNIPLHKLQTDVKLT